MSGEPVVEVDGLWSRFGDREVHRDLTLHVRRGEVLAIIGGSGAGKTVLLRHMIALQEPARGSVRVFGVDLGRCGAAERRRIRQRCGVLFQGGALFSSLSVFENLAAPLRELRGLEEREVARIVMLNVERVGLDPRDARKLPAALSGGMVKRVALARALALEPELLFLDEPTAGLDPVSADAFQELVRQLRRDLDLTVVMVTHDLSTIEALSDRVAALADHTLVALGPLSEVKAAEHPFVREYFSDERARA